MIDWKQTAFLDVDTQCDFIRPEGRLFVPGADRIVENLEKLVNFAVDRNIPIIASVDAHGEDDPEFDTFPPHCVKGTDGQCKIPETTVKQNRVVENRPQEVVKEPGEELVIEKSIYSLFDNVNAEGILERIGRRDYVVFGVALDYCVREAVLGLLKRGYGVWLVIDAVAAVTPEGGEKALAQMREAGARFITTDQVLESD